MLWEPPVSNPYPGKRAHLTGNAGGGNGIIMAGDAESCRRRLCGEKQVREAQEVMSSELAKGIMSRLSPSALGVAVLDAFGRKELVKFMGREGIEYPGVRITSIPEAELAHALIAEALQHEPLLHRLVVILDERHDAMLRRIRGMDLATFRKRTRTLDDILDVGRAGSVIWALFRDGREEMAAEALPFFKRFDYECGREIDGAIRRGLAAGTPKDGGRKKELAELRKKCARLEEENAGLRKRLQEYKAEADRLAGEKGALAKEKRGLGDMLGKLKERMVALQGGVPSDSKPHLRRRVRDLEKENERLAHDLARSREHADAELGEAATRRAKIEGELQEARERSAAFGDEKERANAENARLREALRAMEERISRKAAPAPPPVATGRRVGIFVDCQNVYYLARECYGKRLDYKKLLDVILRGRHCVKALCYIVEAAEVDQDRFLKMLDYCGYTVRKRPLIRRADGSAKGNWDVGIATDVMTLIDKNKLDVVVLVTCDGDFVDLVNVLKQRGLSVEVVGFPNRTAMSLQGSADELYYIREDLMLQGTIGNVPNVVSMDRNGGRDRPPGV